MSRIVPGSRDMAATVCLANPAATAIVSKSRLRLLTYADSRSNRSSIGSRSQRTVSARCSVCAMILSAGESVGKAPLQRGKWQTHPSRSLAQLISGNSSFRKASTYALIRFSVEATSR